MRKRILTPATSGSRLASHAWIDLERLAQVEITSEDPEHPIEGAVVAGGKGWRAAEPGEQVIRILFDAPRPLRHVQLVFEEESRARTQEFVLRWSPDSGTTFRDVVRQQFNFSPPDAREEESYDVELNGVTALELKIVPEIGGGPSVASLRSLRVA